MIIPLSFNLQNVAPESMQGASGLGNTTLSPGVSEGQGFAIEFLITFTLIMVIFGAAADEDNQINVKGSAPLAIGLAITACHLFAVMKHLHQIIFSLYRFYFINI